MENVKIFDNTGSVFSQRVVFDHQPKTGGTSISHWLMNSLGPGCVSQHVTGFHRDIIRSHGGAYSVISGHLMFFGEGLDPRYKYITCLRDPVSRVISWLYFVLNNHTEEQLPGVYNAVKAFVDSDGDELYENILLKNQIQNNYVSHFSKIKRIESNGANESLLSAINNIDEYCYIGFTERMDELAADIGILLGISDPTIPFKNITGGSKNASPKLIKRVEQMNLMDLEFYNTIRLRQRNMPKKPAGKSRYWAGFKGYTK